MNEKAMGSYRALLVEIKYRTEAIDAVLAGTLPLRAKIAEELCYLQLRMICEIIAIGCLVIHGEISSAKVDLFKTYKADWIVSELSRLHPQFFPVALENNDTNDIPPAWIHKTKGYLTKTELAQLWSKQAGSRLHRGSARNLLKTETPLSFDDIRTWRDKIVGLLTRHIISSPDEKHICYFIMNDGQDRVHSALFEQTHKLTSQ
jgi:hypothetical protein